MTKNQSETQTINTIESLFRDHYKSLKIYAYRFVKDLPLAEDIVQDTFVELWNRRSYIEFDGAVKSYLFKSVYNKSLNVLNSKSYATEKTEWTALHEDEISLLADTPYNMQEAILHAKLIADEIQKCIDGLPLQCKKIFLLSRNQDLKNREIAELLGISIKSVEKQITRALSELRSHLTKRDIVFAILLLLSDLFDQNIFF